MGLHRLPWWLRQWRICLQCGRPRFDPWVRKILWRKEWQPTPGFLPGEIPWTEEPGGQQPVGSQRVRCDWATNTQMVWEILVPRPGIEPRPPLQWKHGVPSTRPPGKSLASIISYITLKLSTSLGPEQLGGIRHRAEPGDALIMPSLVLHLAKRQHEVKVTPSSFCRTSPCSCPKATPLGNTQGKPMASLSGLLYGLLSKNTHMCSVQESARNC